MARYIYELPPFLKALTTLSNSHQAHEDVTCKSEDGLSEPHAETHFMVSVADCQASVSLKALCHHVPNKIIELLKQSIDMSVCVGSRPQSSVHILEVQWNRDFLQYFSGPSNLHLVIHGTTDRQNIQDLTPLTVFSRCLTQLEFTNAHVVSLKGIDLFAELRSLNIASIDQIVCRESLSSVDTSKLTKLSKFRVQIGVRAEIFLALTSKLPALQFFTMLLSLDPNVMFSHFREGISPKANYRKLQCLHIKSFNMDTFALTTYADIFAHYLTAVEVLGIYFEYFVYVNDLGLTIDLTKQDLRRIVQRFESCTGVKKLVFVMVGANHMDHFKEEFLSAPSAFDGVSKMKVSLSYNVFE
ncbi:hypothetical protein HDU76_002889 [Blyttiomyces sp. JEL0837]|nr:hypothetical protein HDU76_002889 [Blyttiomyces sp. JEL0837]